MNFLAWMIENMKQRGKEQLFARVPKEKKEAFLGYLFSINTSRFVVISFVVMVIDIFSFGAYFWLYQARDSIFSTSLILVYVVKIMLMFICLFYGTYKKEVGYRAERFLDRHGEIYAVLYMVLETSLFLAGPQDLGALIRYCLVPIIACAIPIIQQRTAFILGFFMFLTSYSILTVGASYQFIYQSYPLLMYLWLGTFLCSSLVSFSVYSWLLRTFIVAGKEKEVREGLKQFNRQLEVLVGQDALSGLKNRRGFQQYLNKTWNKVKQKKKAAIGMICQELAGQKDNLQVESVSRIMQKFGVDCKFQYIREEQIIQFSQSAIELLELPGNISFHSIQELAESVLWGGRDQSRFVKHFSDCVKRQKPYFTIELHLQRRDRSKHPVSVRAQIIYSRDGVVEAVFGLILNVDTIIEYARLHDEYNKVNTITRLPNRGRLYEDMQLLLGRESTKGYLVFLDIYNFKAINGLFSHNIGDKVLRETAVLLGKLIQGQALYSYNVDQYVVLCPSSNQAYVRQLMETISEYFEHHPVVVDGAAPTVRFTMAAVCYSHGTTNVDDLFVDLDIAIQVGKYDLKTRFILFTDQDRENFLLQENLKDNLRKAVANDFQGFLLVYQPIVHSDNKEIAGAEALLRWKDQQGEIVSPLLTIPTLESCGLMEAVEGWIFDTACAQCGEWLRAGGVQDDFFININLSPAAISRPELQEEIPQAIKRNGINLNNIALEVVESSGLLERQSALSVLAALKEYGLRIAIDDFGTGYSSLGYLNTLPADEIKIDRTFINKIGEDKDSQSFLSSIISMAKNMSLLVCIEGVETETQHSILDEMGTDYLQGFYFGKPMVAEEFYRMYAN